jgi:hypothetical protein
LRVFQANATGDKFRLLKEPNYCVIFPLAPQRRSNYASVAVLKMPCIWTFQQPSYMF